MDRHPDFTAEEWEMFEWQYHLMGDFRRAVMEAITRADDGNLLKLALGFPDMVYGYTSYSREEGWWQKVQEKAVEKGLIRREQL